MEDKKEKFVLDRNFDLESATDNFYVESGLIIEELYELYIEKSNLPEEYKKIIFQEMLRAILPEIYKRFRQKYKNP